MKSVKECKEIMKRVTTGKTLAETGHRFSRKAIENNRLTDESRAFAQPFADRLNANTIADHKKRMTRGNKKPQPPRP